MQWVARHYNAANSPTIFFDITTLKDHSDNHDSNYKGYTSAEIRTAVREIEAKPATAGKFVFIDKGRTINAELALERAIKANDVCKADDSPLQKKERRLAISSKSSSTSIFNPSAIKRRPFGDANTQMIEPKRLRVQNRIF